MKKSILLFFISFCLVSSAFAEDSYDKLATELAKSGEGLKKLAIIPFSYADNATSTKDGSVISERLTMKLINMQKFEIIERSVLNKVLDELKLQNSGAIDASSAKELGKVLGVDAIITGTLIPTNEGKIEVNARLIKTETAQAIGASQVYVEKDWIGGDMQVAPKPVYQQQAYTPTQTVTPTQQVEPAHRSPKEYSFFEVLAGFGSQTVDIKWDSSKFGGAEQTGLTATGAGPIGFRVGGFGKGILGGDLELAVSRHYTDKQVASVNNILLPVNLPEGYIDATTFELGFDGFLRTPTKAQFYTGLGLGLTINNIKSNLIRDNYNKLLNETDVGLLLRFPIGLRFNMDNTTFFLEYRFESNITSFNRGYSGESDTLTFNGSRFCFGLGSKF
jgi:TolB-like protein